MDIFTKILAFILLILWGFFTLIIMFSIIGAIVLGCAEKWDDWFCGGRRLIEAILQKTV